MKTPNNHSGSVHRASLRLSGAGGPAILTVAVFAVVAILVPNLIAEGFRNSPPGTFNLGRAGGRIAQIDDSSAIQQNPANLIDVPGAQAQLTPSIIYIN